MNITYDSKCLFKNGKPFIPIMGEMQYSRTNHKFWKENIYKMKSVGIDIISTYVFWNHHEEEKGVFDFSGNRNLKEFVNEVKNAGLMLCLRIGPWVHGESRNGGFPDWVEALGEKARTNDAEYLQYVKRYFEQIFEQVKGFFLNDGGPIVAIQIENEYGHCGGLTGKDGYEHMCTLQKILEDIGFSVPLYLATGWGNAEIGKCLPIWGGYCEAPWTNSTQELPPMQSYLYRQDRNDTDIGSDFGVHENEDDCYNEPYLTVEIGSGMHNTALRRPVIHGKDIGALINAKLGSGAAMMGYYVMCGGYNPKGKFSTLQEYSDFGVPLYDLAHTLPEFDYDFQAPIRQFGGLRDTFGYIKNLNYFCHDFGEQLALMTPKFQSKNPTDATDLESLRYVVRSDGNSGFLFINNYQRRYVMADHNLQSFEVPLETETATLKDLSINNGEFVIYPINLKIGNAVLKTAKATPLCILNKTDYVFVTNNEPEFDIDGNLDNNSLIVLSEDEALNAYKISLDKDYLFISDALVYKTDEGIVLQGENISSFKVYPQLPITPKGYTLKEKKSDFYIYKTNNPDYLATVEFGEKGITESGKTYKISVNYDKQYENAFINISYAGNRAKLYVNGEFVADQFYNGSDWVVGLREFGFPNELEMEIITLNEDSPVFLENHPKYTDKKANYINSIHFRPEYKKVIIR